MAAYEPRPLTETRNGRSFAATNDNGHKLLGVGPRIKKIGFISVNVYAAGFYVDADALAEVLKDFPPGTSSSSSKVVDAIVSGNYPRSWELITVRNLSKKQLSDGFREGLEVRIPKADHGLIDQLSATIDHDASSGAKITFSTTPEGEFIFNFDGNQGEPIQSTVLCEAIAGVFFDGKPLGINSELTAGLLKRLPEFFTAAPAVSAVGGVSIKKKGWLNKYMLHAVGVLRKKWQPRWFRLNSEKRRLTYWKDPSDATPLGVISLDDVEIISEGEKSGKGSLTGTRDNYYAFRLNLKNSNKFYRLSSNVEDGKAWFEFIQKAIDAKSGAVPKVITFEGEGESAVASSDDSTTSSNDIRDLVIAFLFLLIAIVLYKRS